MTVLCFVVLLCSLTCPVADTISARTCSNSQDCSLNGACIDGTCHCDSPWEGDTCQHMRLLPTKAVQGYAMQPNLTSWGGGILFDGGKYHLFVCVMTNQCPLSTWRQNSRIDHAVADEVTGPYAFNDIAINTWSHNPAPVRLADGSFAIFHIGDGSGTPGGGKNCTTGDILDGAQEDRKVFVIHDFANDWADRAYQQFLLFMHTNGVSPSDWDLTALDNRGQAVEGPETIGKEQFPISIVATKKMQEGSSIHVSTSLYGPWKPLEPNSLGICNNPAPWVHVNGTIFIVCDGVLKRAERIFGPWTTVSSIKLAGLPGVKYEDPFLYVDSRGFHILYHAYNTAERERCTNATVSAHAFSEDGHTWLVSSVQPFSNRIAVEGLGEVTVSTRERPNVLFNGRGQMTHLISAVCHAEACPSEAPCANCKYNHWDYTIAQPFDTSQSLRKGAKKCAGSPAGACAAAKLQELAAFRGSLAVR
eukprot:TRINITY_DN63474_c0_g1_i1.p1 TRINITY_DN63474_c0_g1~~TRINITY_DN63474_c0_g1_i1.p1  ORF type:complete len:475 (-),score=56.25 TRINITY_DN63474_c0_g1_i1:119-1543(-)